jgi:hypothetical protein
MKMTFAFFASLRETKRCVDTIARKRDMFMHPLESIMPAYMVGSLISIGRFWGTFLWSKALSERDRSWSGILMNEYYRLHLSRSLARLRLVLAAKFKPASVYSLYTLLFFLRNFEKFSKFYDKQPGES